MPSDGRSGRWSRPVARTKVGAALLLAVVPSIASAQAQAEAPVRTRVTGGAIAGSSDAGIVTFKGIPYAAPPVGDLRWRAPQPVTGWQGERPATGYGAICEQVLHDGDDGVGPSPMSEDCLTLNVFAPVGAKRAPVMVWIHGGGFINGSSGAPIYDGSALARRGVVLVTLNYRLGRFGVFAHPALTADAHGEPLANYGLMDIVAALRWVRDNIAAVSGDATNVTIFGESAGGVAVNDLMVSPAARGLFSRAIVESGLGRERVASMPEAEAAGVAFASAVQLVRPSVADLKRLSSEQILKVEEANLFTGGGPVADCRVLPMSPMDGFRRGLEAAVPYIIGWNSLDTPLAPEVITANKQVGSVLPADLLARARVGYGSEADYRNHFISDLVFTEPGSTLARLHAARGLPTYVYQFSIVPESLRSSMRGAAHGAERAYVFGTLAGSKSPGDAVDAAQSALIGSYWTAFARTGDPNGADRPTWPRFGRAGDTILDFGDDGARITVVPRAKAQQAIGSTYLSGH